MGILKQRRSWLRFSLRTLLIATAVASALLGWRVKRVCDVDAAIVAVERAGGTIYRFESTIDPTGGPPTLIVSPNNQNFWKQLTVTNRSPPPKTPTPNWNDWRQRMIYGEGAGTWHVKFNRRLTRVTDAQLDEVTARLARIDDVTELTLWRNPVSEEGLRSIARLKDLTELHLHSASLTARSIAHLQSLPRLRLLDLAVSSEHEIDVDVLRCALPLCEIKTNGQTYPPLMVR